MSTDTTSLESETIVGSIENQTDPSQRIDIKYVQNENAFVTSGIYTHFAEKEISIPGHLVVMDFQLMGTIVSEILEKLSQARDGETTFAYAPQLQVLDKLYSLEDGGEYMMLKEAISEQTDSS
ncbi:MAG: hypothetical protein B6240_04800 [Desulfobacteraceae bacterium 4572_87]|nr:MAG: hypothetical protein B6240_04800 [Desulfobacteraceae bacterium 4572_87]